MLKRPEINLADVLRKVFISLVALLFISAITSFILKELFIESGWKGSDFFNPLSKSAGYLFLFLLFVVIVIKVKNILIWLITVYQRFAPEDIRSACLFEPTCSEYMILAVEKYGVIKGVSKGISRLFRCKLPNGGLDYP